MKNKFFVWKITLIACLIFAFGVFVGIFITKFNSITLEGYGYTTSFNALIGAVGCSTSSNATSSNATSSNATSSNATSSNATSSNATSSNATSSNATSSNATSSNATSSNATSSNATSSNATSSSTASSNTTSDISNLNNNNTSSENNKLDKEEVEENEILKLVLKSNKKELGEKIYLEFQTKTNNITSIKLEFLNGDEKFTVDVNSVFNNPYIILPDNIKVGKYTLNKIVLNYSDTQKVYEDGTIEYNKIFDEKVSLDIISIDGSSVLEIDNINIDEETIEKISNSEKKLTVILDCSKSVKVSSKVFEAIKKSGSKLILLYNGHKMTFFGEDISNIKDIQFKVEVLDITNDEGINEMLENGLIIKFPDNNELPGKAIVNIKIDKQYKELFNNKLNLYFVNNESNQLDLIRSDIEIQDDFVTFELYHNSSYVISNNKLNDEVVSFLNNKIIYVAVIVLCVVIIAIVAIIIIFKTKSSKIGNKEVEHKYEE